MKGIQIRKAKVEDAPFLAKTVMEAIGEDLCIDLGEGRENLDKVVRLFSNLSARENTQYSFWNSFVAETSDGKTVGAIIAYDGSRLPVLRKEFIKEANHILKWNVRVEDAGKWGDEARPDEIYIDSIYVEPGYRKQGIAKALINTVKDYFSESEKPLGLLVEPENETAKTAYEKLGFKYIDKNNFFGFPMLHLQWKV